eukprot:7389365-Prymnesium_polylepis.2
MIDDTELPARASCEPMGDYVGVKAPMFSFQRLKGADPSLGVEMSSTGEVCQPPPHPAACTPMHARPLARPPVLTSVLVAGGLLRPQPA